MSDSSDKLYGFDMVFHLTNLESRFFAILSENIGTMVSKAQFIKALWEVFDDSRSKEKFLHNLAYAIRNYFKKDDNVMLEMVSKKGYRISVKEVE